MYKKIIILTILIILLPDIVFGVSNTIITSDLQFKLFNLNNVSIYKENENAILFLNNHFEILSLVNSPPKRHSFGVDVSSCSDKIVLFGGIDSDSYPNLFYNDFWSFDEEKKWQRILISTNIAARYGHSMVNIGKEKFLIFGGLGENAFYFNDTYIVDIEKKEIQQIYTSTAPSKRYYHSMCFVPTQNKVYLFGGNFQGFPLNDMWVFDLNTLNWQKINPPQTVPQARWGHKMLYVEKHKKIYIFGGQKDYTPSGLLYDLWWYDVSNNTFFEIKNPQSNWPVGLSHFGMSYNKATDSLIVFGGYKSENPNYSNEVWFFNIVSTSFVKSPILYLNSPEGIEKSCLINIADKFLVYGGFNGTSCLDKTYYYYYSSSGSATSDIIYFTNPTKLYFKQLTISPLTQPEKSDIKMQVSCSTDGVNFSKFLGPDGTENTYFSIQQSNFTSDFFNDKNMLKIKVNFYAYQPPLNPYVDKIIITYNLAPYAPSLIEPKNYSSTNTLNPTFYWQKPNDPDNDTNFTYKLLISKNTDFSNIVFQQDNLIDTKFKIPYPYELSTGIYFWKLLAKDPDESNYSQTFQIEIDTTPPKEVFWINAYTGPQNNQIVVETYITGDDEDKGTFSGSVVVGLSTVSYILTEDDFEKSYKYIYTPPPQQPNRKISFIVSGLENDTTYFINLKLADEAGNYSKISTCCVYAITNFTPKLKILSPQNNSILSGDNILISWEYSDLNQEDTHRFILYLSTDKVNFFKISDSLPDKTTYYVWNSLSVKNGIYVLKVSCIDQRNLEGFDLKENIYIQNENFPPKILKIIKPSKDDILVGLSKISWELYDPNLQDTHTYKIYITQDNINFILTDEINYDTEEFYFDTTRFKNARNYRIKLEVSDGEYKDEVVSEIFSIKNNNFPPEKPKIISPENFSYTSPYKVKLKWQQCIDLNNDKVLYELYLSTIAKFETITFSTTNLKETEFEISYPIIDEQKIFYWYVVAKDIFDEKTNSDRYTFITYPKYKSISEDKKIYVELLEVPKEKVFIYVSKICEYTERQKFAKVSLADNKDKTNRYIKTIPYAIYEINLYDENFNIVESTCIFKIVADVSDVIYKKHAKISFLDEESLSWIFPSYKQNLTFSKELLSENTVETYSNKFGYYTVILKDKSYNPITNITIYPNPFDPNLEELTVEYILTEDLKLEVYIFNSSGGLVKKFSFEKGIYGKTCGSPEGQLNSFKWDGKNDKGIIVANGVYICKLVFNEHTIYKNIAVLKK